MIVIGIAGGIASGKSLVTSCFQHFGAVVLDGDQIGHRLLRQSDLVQQIIDRWGDGILDGNQINRTRLARIVFAPGDGGATALRELERLTHPRIKDEISRRLEQARRDGSVQACVLDAPVMFKAGWHHLCDEIVFVDTPEEIRIQRAVSRGWRPEELAKRERNQTPIDSKRKAATQVIDNSGSKVATYQQAVQVWRGCGLNLQLELHDPSTLFLKNDN